MYAYTYIISITWLTKDNTFSLHFYKIQRRQIFANPNDWEIEGIYAVYQSVSGATGGSSNASMKNQYAKVLIPEKKSRDEFSEKWNMLPKTEERIYDEMSTSNYQELPLSIVKLKEMLARGRHGPVHKGIWQNGKELEYIAVKVLRKGASPKERVELLQEALILGRFQHPNVLKLHGVITLVEPVRCSRHTKSFYQLSTIIHSSIYLAAVIVQKNDSYFGLIIIIISRIHP